MEEIIKEINVIPGVESTCLFTYNGEIIDCSLEGQAKEQMINAGRIIFKLLLSGSSQVEDLISLSICYEESMINARKLKSGNFIVIKHSQTTDVNLINLTIESSYSFTTQNKTEVNTEKGPSDLTTASQSIPNITEANPIKKAREYKPGSQSTQLPSIIAGMQRAFIRLEGAEAQTSFKATLIKWSSNHDPKLSTLKFLVDMLSNELKNQEKIDKFRKMILPYLAYARDN